MELTALAGIIFLAVVLEGTLTYIFNSKDQEAEPREWIKYVALLAGIGLAIVYKIDLPTLLGLKLNVLIMNYVISGIAIGRGSNYINDLAGLFKPKK